jgi:hypothetical protein
LLTVNEIGEAARRIAGVVTRLRGNE